MKRAARRTFRKNSPGFGAKKMAEMWPGPQAKRRLFYWERARSPKGFLSAFIGTSFGAGLLPYAPGTFGTLVGVPIAIFTADWSLGERLALWGALFVAGTWACKELDEIMGSHDNQNLVMDETVGLGIT